MQKIAPYNIPKEEKMRAEELTGMETEELIDLLLMPKRLRYAEEEILVTAELSVRSLTPGQQAVVLHRMPAERRRYNYRVSALNGYA